MDEKKLFYLKKSFFLGNYSVSARYCFFAVLPYVIIIMILIVHEESRIKDVLTQRERNNTDQELQT